MTREELDVIIGAIAEQITEKTKAAKAEMIEYVERLVASKPLPPFMPPPIWTAGRHGAGSVVRAHGGLFMARRDTEAEPLLDDDGSWLPLVVGLAGFDMRWVDDHKFVVMAHLSDGRQVETEREIAVPIVRGYWEPEATYMPGDRVFRFGEWHCHKMALGVDPTTDDAGYWEKVGGKYATAPKLKFTADGTWLLDGRDIGTAAPLFKQLVDQAVAELRSKQAA